MKSIYYTATSLDGFVATPEDSVAFLDEVDQPSEDTYTPFIAKIGALVMGSATYEFLLRHVGGGGDWPYSGLPVWVLTSRDLPVIEKADIRFFSGPVEPLYREIELHAGTKDLWIVGGGNVAAQFIAAGLVDEIVATVASTTLGSGKQLLPINCKLKLLSARALGEGFAELRYAPKHG